jgi:hypothetical protein
LHGEKPIDILRFNKWKLLRNNIMSKSVIIFIVLLAASWCKGQGYWEKMYQERLDSVSNKVDTCTSLKENRSSNSHNDSLKDSIEGMNIYKKADLTFSPEWKFVSATKDYIFEVNKEPVSIKNGIVKIWTRNRITPYFSIIKKIREQTGKKNNPYNKDFSRYLYDKNLYEYDCDEKKFRLLSGTEYDEENDVIATWESKSSENGEWSYVIPETVGESVLKYVCQRFNKKSSHKKTMEKDK